MKAKERLALLEEVREYVTNTICDPMYACVCIFLSLHRFPICHQVAGTKVYEERRAESFKILKQTDLRREKIQDVIRDIETKLQTLEGEKDDLRQYRDPRIESSTRKSVC